jgi:hypothetical protein
MLTTLGGKREKVYEIDQEKCKKDVEEGYSLAA